MRPKLLFGVVLTTAISSLGCASATPPSTARAPAAPQPASDGTTPAGTSEAARTEATESGVKLPATCEDATAGVCTPPAAFASKLCDGSHPDIALAMFGKDTPWTRAYLRRNVEAWNAAGGRTSTSAKLEFDEEVIILVRRQPKTGGMQVSGATGSLDVLRWDGTCASLMSDEITMKRPPKAKNAPIPWRELDLRVRDALLTDEAIEKTDAERRKECKSSLGTERSPKCAKADAQLGMVIAEHVRSGGPLPLPDHIR